MVTKDNVEELKSFLTEKIGMDEEEMEKRADELVENNEVLLRVNAYEKLKEENAAQVQDSTDIEGAFLGVQERRYNGELQGYITWVFSSRSNQVERISSDNNLVSGQHRQFESVTVTDVEHWENLDTGSSWLSVSDDTSIEFGNELVVDVISYAQEVDEVDADQTYLVMAEINDVDTLGKFHPESGEYLGREPVIENEDKANLRLVLQNPRSGNQATIKLKDPRTLSELCGEELPFERLMKAGAQMDAQELSQQLYSVLAGEEVIVFARGSAYVDGEEVTDSDGNRRPWLTLSNFENGFIRSVTALEAEADEIEAQSAN